MKTRQAGLVMGIVLGLGALIAAGAGAANTAAAQATTTDLSQNALLSEVSRHLYRWYLDESDLERVSLDSNTVFWVRALEIPLDAGDRSRFGEILLPRLGLAVRLKKADYTIEEMGVTVTSGTFKIVNVRRGEMPAVCPAGCREILMPVKEIKDYLFQTRNQRDYPDENLGRRLHVAVSNALDKAEAVPLAVRDLPEQVIYVSPLSPVANELWIFWETGRTLLRISSDIDLANPAVWDHDSLMVRIYDIEKGVLVSLEEAPGSNKYMTRDQIGRAIYNCIVFGQRLVLRDTAPPVPAPAVSSRS